MGYEKPVRVPNFDIILHIQNVFVICQSTNNVVGTRPRMFLIRYYIVSADSNVPFY